MKRRTFLGGILGLVAGTQIRIPAEESKAKEPPNWVDKAKRQLRCFELDRDEFKKFRIDLITGDQHCYKGLNIEKVEVLDKEGRNVQFKAASIIVQSTCDFRGFRLIDDEGFVISEKDFVMNCRLNAGDSLNLTYDIYWGGEI